MSKLTKLTAGLTAVAVMAAGLMAFAPAKAQTTESARTQAEENEGVTTTQGALGGAYNNPISQWIVLTGLFAPYAYGYGVGGGGIAGGAMYNPISQWIVLSGLFNPVAFSGAAATQSATVDP